MPTDLYLSSRLYWYSAPYFAALGIRRDLSQPAEKGYLGACGEWRLFVADADDPRMVDAMPPEIEALIAEAKTAGKGVFGGFVPGSQLIRANVRWKWQNHPRFAPGGLHDQLVKGTKNE